MSGRCRTPTVSRTALGLAGCLAAALLGGCVGGRVTTADLVDDIGAAEAFTETAVVDVGTPAARRHLLSGWRSGDELWAGRPDQSFVWIDADVAQMRFFVFEQRDLVLLVRARPNPQLSGSGELSCILSLNGEPLTRLTVTPGWDTYRATVPRQLLSVGENLLGFHFGDVDGDGTLLVAVDRVDLERTIITYPPRRALGESKALILPYLSGIWYRVEGHGDAILTADAVRMYGPRAANPGGALEIVVDAGGEAVRQRFEIGSSIAMPLPARTSRIGLIAVPAGDPNSRVDRRQNEEAVGLLLEAPRILEPPG